MIDLVKSFDKAAGAFWQHDYISVDGRGINVALLVRTKDWVPLRAEWWNGKEVSVIGVDVDGNFFLRHCDGSVRYRNHASQSHKVVAKSVNEFANMLTRAP
jgi:hypothetical protein